MQLNEQEQSAFKRVFVPCLQTERAGRSTMRMHTPPSLPRDGVKHAHRARLRGPIALLGLFILIHAHSMAGETTLVSLGPRYGFSRKDPLLGKRQTANFGLVDVAALFRLPSITLRSATPMAW